MNSLVYSANIIIPVFLLILLGMFSRRRGLIDDSFITISNRIVFTMALPASLFSMVSRSDFAGLFDPVLILVTFGGTLAGFFITWGLSRPLCAGNHQRGAFVQASTRGNLAIFGIAIAARALSPDTVAVGAGLLVFLIPLYNFLAVIALTGWNQTGDRKERLVKQVKGIFMNPLMIAIFLGVLFSMMQIGLPAILDTTLGYVSRMTVPLALLGIGGTLKLSGLRERWLPTLGAGLGKLILMPLLVMAGAWIAGIKGETLALLFILAGSPVAVSSFAMAGALKNDTELTADVITMTTIFSLLTIGGGLALMNGAGIIG